MVQVDSLHDQLLSLLKDSEEARKKFLPRMTRYIPLTPTPKQQAFMLLDCLDAFYGGAAGGGKSVALLMCALQYVDCPDYHAVLFRDTYQNLTKPGSLLSLAHEWLTKTDAKWIATEKKYLFPSKATLTFSYLDSPRDHYNHLSAAYQFIGMDECVNIRENQALYLFSRLRKSANNPIPLRFRCASNPPTNEQLGRGSWVKKRYVDKATRGRRVFLPANLDDNKYIDREEYIKSLSNLDAVTCAQLLHGDWEIQAQGGMFEAKWFNDNIVDPKDAPGKEEGQCIRGWDLAGSLNKQAAYTVGVKIRRLPNGIYYVEDVRRFKGTPHKVDAEIKECAMADGYQTIIDIPQDPGQSGKYQKAYLFRLLEGFQVISSPESGSKEDRAKAVSSQLEVGNIKIVKGGWNSEFIYECLMFPGGTYCDQVDAFSRAYHSLARRFGIMPRHVAPKGEKLTRIVGYDLPTKSMAIEKEENESIKRKSKFARPIWRSTG